MGATGNTLENAGNTLDLAYLLVVYIVWKMDGVSPAKHDGSVSDGGQIYGNGSYFKSTQYSTSLILSTGVHRLWHGMIINTGRAIEYETGWHGQGWIDIVGIKFGENVLEPVYPK